MQSKASSVEEYLKNLPADRKEAVTKLRNQVKSNLPKGFEEIMNYGMPGYVVPHKLFPEGYHVDPALPLPFINIASQKNYISFYHMGLYSGALLDWFLKEWSLVNKKKPDMGKCCVRFKKVEDIPYELIGKLASKMSPEDWISIYVKNRDHRT